MGATGLEVTGTQENNSFFVNDVKEKSVAERLGIKSGDRILVVNGQSLSKKISFRVAQRQLIQDEPFSLRLLRDGSEKTLTATTDFSFDPYAEPDESPVHRVEIKPFFLSKYEMTQGQWLRSTGKNPSYYPAGKTVGGQQFSLLHPVEYVSWERCRDILRWNDLDLPSEAQWEYAARAGTKTVWSTGNDPRTLQDHANIADYFLAQKFPSMSSQCESTINDGYAGHAPIASYKANHFGLHDMEGNVSEWCDDSYFEGGYRRSSKPASERKVGRGGRWSHNARYSRSADRGAFVASTRRQDLGMRPMRRVRP
jgi:formylglycine-generating enzyme required for sulfatase activity